MTTKVWHKLPGKLEISKPLSDLVCKRLNQPYLIAREVSGYLNYGHDLTKEFKYTCIVLLACFYSSY